jgi:muramoyltetrapeptide carboxypeptidase LdcA involved in peptidoglycan recycling
MLSLISEFIPNNNIPIILNFPHGHQLPNITLPHGAFVELNTTSQLLTVV